MLEEQNGLLVEQYSFIKRLNSYKNNIHIKIINQKQNQIKKHEQQLFHQDNAIKAFQ